MLHIVLNNDKKKFINNVAYFKGKDNYCLGNSFEEAGDVSNAELREIYKKYKKNKYITQSEKAEVV